MPNISYLFGPGQSFIFCARIGIVLSCPPETSIHLKRAQTKLWWSTLLSPENRNHAQGLDLSPSCMVRSLSLLSLQGTADRAPAPASSGGVAALTWATVVLTAARRGHTEFHPCCQCCVSQVLQLCPKRYRPWWQVLWLPSRLHILIPSGPHGSQWTVYRCLQRSKTCNHRTESDWLHRLSNPVIRNHRQLHPFSDVRLLSQIRQVSSPSVPESRTGLIRRASL